VEELAMLSEILPRERDCAFSPLTAVNMAPRMLMDRLAAYRDLRVVTQVSGPFKQTAGQMPEPALPQALSKD
jgi:hypothetical protein